MRTASKSPAGKEMVASPCGQASCGPEDAQCGLYTRGGGGSRGHSTCLVVLPASLSSETQASFQIES